MYSIKKTYKNRKQKKRQRKWYFKIKQKIIVFQKIKINIIILLKIIILKKIDNKKEENNTNSNDNSILIFQINQAINLIKI